MIPHDAPASHAASSRSDEPTNPAKPLLILIGGLYAATSPMAILAGLQAGLYLVVAGISMLVLGCATIWLALRNFNALFRNATMIWGCCLIAFFGWALFSAYEANDIGGAVFFGVMLIIVTPIPILAIRQSVASNRTDPKSRTPSDPRQ